MGFRFVALFRERGIEYVLVAFGQVILGIVDFLETISHYSTMMTNSTKEEGTFPEENPRSHLLPGVWALDPTPSLLVSLLVKLSGFQPEEPVCCHHTASVYKRTPDLSPERLITPDDEEYQV